MTSKELAKIIFPDVSKDLDAYTGEGAFLIKTVMRPFWFPITKLGIEIAVALTKPKVQPILPYLEDLLPLIPDQYKEFYAGFMELMHTPKATFEGEPEGGTN